MPSLYKEIQAAMGQHGDAAHQSLALLDSWNLRLPHIPGCDTLGRIAYRIYHGATVEEAAAREYLYRWRLTIDQMNNQRDDVPTRINAAPLMSHYAPSLLGV